ncbi:group 2 major outer membrane porin protein PorA [Campylobacter jejuni]|uniref:Group 2 major outer membrane porin protein PorA n=1 Tax=Campylobacter jejuni TaxID=197 RepID=A0A5Y8QW29_CAMJU|nr:group 2 major outer membrane porin protein PorA [Campylobacter jejuni]AZN11297.1 group 2 major outer membrane porin protein PorA [Campylobacter jejuni subsp. jejuni]EAH9323011.1 group 2 major outer membrane porin protein PorA [Campylobacter jejuni]EAI4900828.1 group 2 major outer membrane porin protein PorA [Campylobacter jejuni]EAI9777806.1 group 2 major outer membrane porin protein PorA [Campylobacter jejuni]EAJ2067542.1 group 2 major outer membrane porin protein PorA [Campylobacter jejun
MKLVKLSLVAALAASAFSAANATPLEEAIKDIDVSGVLRYRYESSNPWSNANFGSGISGKQDHKYRAQVNFSGAISDNFKAFVQFDYNSQDGGYGADSISNTSDTLSVRQLYLTYTNEDVATSVIAGKQQLNTIWTDNAIDGLVGTGIKVVNNSIDGLTLAAFAMDSFNEASDTTVTITQDNSQKITGVQFNRGNPKGDSDVSGALDWSKNIYGAAAIGSYDIAGGQFNPQLWLAYMSDNAFLYALDAAYSTTIFDGINWTIEGAYLGNSVDNKLKDRLDAANGNFFALRGTVEVNGWDASLGGLYYGKKDKVTLTTIEDQGNLGSLLAGEEIFYTNGSNLNGDIGRNIFGYVTAGYTFNETVRVGADFVYGGTKTNIIGQGGKKLEAVARVDYKYSPKLNFSAFYSYVNVDTDPESTHHDAVRLQALYKF